MNEGLSEFIGAFIGDGCLSSYPIKKGLYKAEVIQFTGGWSKDNLYYRKIIGSIIKKNFKIELRVYHRKDDDTVRAYTYNKKVINFLRSLHFSFGPKANTVVIPTSIVNNKKLSISCVRGIFNTDGCVYRRYSKKYNRHNKVYSYYKIIQFKSNSVLLIEQIKTILNNLKIKTNRIIKDEKAYVLRVTSQQEVNKFISTIKLNHQYHINRIK